MRWEHNLKSVRAALLGKRGVEKTCNSAISIRPNELHFAVILDLMNEHIASESKAGKKNNGNDKRFHMLRGDT